MPETCEIAFNGDVKQLLTDLRNAIPSQNDTATSNSSSDSPKNNSPHDSSPPLGNYQLSADINAKALSHIIQTLASIDNKFETLTMEINSLKNELEDSKKMISVQRQEIEDLKKANESLTAKTIANESNARRNSLLLSGPLVSGNDTHSPNLLREQAVQQIKNVYNFDLPKNEIASCHRVPGKERSKDRIILTLTNNFIKSDLMSKVVQMDKRNGVALNINEHLSQYHASLLYQLRNLRKTNHNKIFSCFSRNGRVFYKAQKDSKPTLISKPDEITDLAKEIAQHGALLRRRSVNQLSQSQNRNRSDRTLRSSANNHPTSPSASH